MLALKTDFFATSLREDIWSLVLQLSKMEGWLEGERRRSCWNTGIIISVRLLGYYHNALPCPLLPSLEGMSQMRQKRNRNCVKISDLPSFLLLCVLSGTFFFLFLIPFSHPPPPHDYFLLSGLTFKACSVLGPLHMPIFSRNLNSTLQCKHLFIDFLKTRFEQQDHKLESDGGRTQPWTVWSRRRGGVLALHCAPAGGSGGLCWPKRQPTFTTAGPWAAPAPTLSARDSARPLSTAASFT